MNIVARVRYSRNCTNDTFPLPNVGDCIRYAITELAEMVDAQLRMSQPEHLRNNHRNHDPRKECGQAGYMLISAWIQLRREDTFTVLDMRQTESFDLAFVDASHEVLFALESAIMGDRNGLELYSAIESWIHLCAVAGWDADALIAETCTDFERKHCVTREVVP